MYTRNQTTKYLLPCINTFGSTFLKELDSLTNYALGHTILSSATQIGIGDAPYFRAKKFPKKSLLFIVFDTLGPYNDHKNFYIDVNKGKLRFQNFLSYVRNTSFYVDDYWFNKNQHCVVFNLAKFEHSYNMFLKSRYSLMYTLEQIKQLQIPAKIKKKNREYDGGVYTVLTKGKSGKTFLKSVVEEKFGVTDIADDPLEYDVNWLPQDEIFLWELLNEQEKQKIYDLKY